MKCQRCSEPASIHLSEAVDGKRRDIHLCAECARRDGLALPPPPDPALLESIVHNLIVAHVGELVGTLAQTVCPYCGLKFMEYRATGQLGCPHDYEAFERGLVPLLRRAHGATRHVGKLPRHRAIRTKRLRLRAQLRAAIAREDYELAAQLRDQLRPEDPQA